MDERALRASLQAVGPVLPVVTYMGAVIDGEKRERICGELRLDITKRVCASLGEACALLWTQHPERAVELAQRYGASRLTELAELCNVRASELAVMLQKMRPPPPKRVRGPKVTYNQKTVVVQVFVEPQLHHIIKKAAAHEGMTISAFVRAAVWQRARIVDGRLARGGPEQAWLKPKERRVLKR